MLHHLELFLDAEVQLAVVKHFGLDPDIHDRTSANAARPSIALQRFLGYDLVRRQPRNWDYPRKSIESADTTAGEQRPGHSRLGR